MLSLSRMCCLFAPHARINEGKSTRYDRPASSAPPPPLLLLPNHRKAALCTAARAMFTLQNRSHLGNKQYTHTHHVCSLARSLPVQFIDCNSPTCARCTPPTRWARTHAGACECACIEPMPALRNVCVCARERESSAPPLAMLHETVYLPSTHPTHPVIVSSHSAAMLVGALSCARAA